MGALSETLSLIGIAEKVYFYASKSKYRKHNYYYDYYNRKTYINSNGDGIILISCDLVVIDPLKTKELTINLDISDSKESTKFPDFSDMIKSGLQPFNDFMFKCYSDCDIISRVVESYDSLPGAERKTNKKSKKHISLALKIDSNKIQKNKKYNIKYMFSIPGMFPITNGVWDDTYDDESCECSSFMECNEHFNKVKYSLYLDSNISVDEDIKANVRTAKSNEEIPLNIEKQECMFYNKYIVEVKKAKNNKYFSLLWHVNKAQCTESEVEMDRLSQK